MAQDDIETVRQRVEAARRRMTEPVTITLTFDEWQSVLAAMYRAVLYDADQIGKADRAMDDDELDPLMLADVLSRTYELRSTLHELMHQGENDQASWSADEVQP